MELSENGPLSFEDHKKGLIAEVSGLEEKKIIKLANIMGYGSIEGSEEALKFVIESIKDAKDQDDFQTIQRKYHNLDEIEVK
jgi:hypothetical protein